MRKNKKTGKHQPLIIKLLFIIPLITIVSWAVAAYFASNYLHDSLWREFTKYNKLILNSVGRQGVIDLRYGDYFQLKRTLHDFYDQEFMRYFAFYTKDKKLLSSYPTQLSGEEMHVMDQMLSELGDGEDERKYFDYDGEGRFHFQNQLINENSEIVGYLVMGGITTSLQNTIEKQLFSFIALGIVFLFIQIAAIGYFVNRFTKPLRNLTKSLIDAEHKKPEEVIPALMKQEPTSNASSEVHFFYKTYKHLLQEIQKHQESAKHMAVQAAIGKIASHIAHDMRSPLSVIRSAIDPNMANNPDKDLLVSIGQTSVEKLNKMADDLLDYSKARHVDRQLTDVNVVIQETIHEASEIMKADSKNIKFNIAAPNECYANIDSHRINRALVNFLTNAIQAIRHGSGVIEVEVIKSDKDLTFRIRDNGSGIPPEHLLHIFDGTFTFGKKSGSGLGLSYCKNVIEAHGGEILTKSVLGKGTTFTIILPGVVVSPSKVLVGKNKVERQNVSEKTNKKSSDKKVLVMDDDEGLLVYWNLMLKDVLKNEPIQFSSPEKLLESNINVKDLDLAIVDYEFMGSEMNGIDVLTYLKEKGLNTLYLCTAYYQDDEIQKKASELGVKMIIPKPIPDDILSQIL